MEQQGQNITGLNTHDVMTETEREKELNACRLAQYLFCTIDGASKELYDCVTLLDKKDYKGAKEILQKRMDFYQSMLDKI